MSRARRDRRGLPAVLLLGLALAACDKGASRPGGREVPRAATPAQGQPARHEPPVPQRIVSIVPAVTEMLFAIGAGPRVVGVGSFDTYPPEVASLPRLGALLDPDVERIISLRADLAVIHDSQAELGEKLTRAGIRTYAYALGGLDNVTRTLRDIGALTGQPWQAQLVAEMIEARLDAIRRRVATRPRPRTMLVFGRDPMSLRNIYVSGGAGFLHDLLEVAGGANAFASIRRESLQATTEAILSAAPDVIIELRYGRSLAAERLDADRLSWNALASVPAVRAGRVHLLVGDELVVPGPRVADTAERFARVLHPDVFRDSMRRDPAALVRVAGLSRSRPSE